MTLRTRLTKKLSIKHPVLLAPMGSIAGGQLAAAVSEAGGLGLIGGGYGNEDWLEREFAAAGNQRVGYGIHHLVACQKAAPVRLSAGSSASCANALIRRSKAIRFAYRRGRDAAYLSGSEPRSCAPSARLRLEVIVAQGTEAGGHGGGRATLPLVPAVVDLVARRAPEAIVVTSGGIADGRGLAAALSLGAEGVLVGTRFYATVESLGHENARARILASSGEDTVRTSVFDTVRGYQWPNGITGRALRNDFAERWHGHERKLAVVLDSERMRYQAAAASSEVDSAVVFAGEGADLIEDLPQASEVVTRRMVAEAERSLAAARSQIA